MGLACSLVVLLLQCRSILCFHPVYVLSLWCFYRELLLLRRSLLVRRYGKQTEISMSDEEKLCKNLLTAKLCWKFEFLVPAKSVKYVFTKPFARIGCDRRSISKRILTGLKSEFSFSKTGCLIEAKKILLFTHSWWENYWILAFPMDISAMWNVIGLVQDSNLISRAHFPWR